MYNPPDGKNYKWYISGIYIILGGGFRCSLLSTLPGEMVNLTFPYFSDGQMGLKLNHQLVQGLPGKRPQGETKSLITCWNCSVRWWETKGAIFLTHLGILFFFVGPCLKLTFSGKMDGWLVQMILNFWTPTRHILRVNWLGGLVSGRVSLGDFVVDK